VSGACLAGLRDSGPPLAQPVGREQGVGAAGDPGVNSRGAAEMPTSAPQKVTTFLMFEGKAEQAMAFYNTL
jgi:hypothetical protein